MNPRKNIISKNLNSNSSKAPDKTILPRNKFHQKSTYHRNNITQRRFSLINSDSDSSELSEFESDDNDNDNYQEHLKTDTYENKFTAIESSSETESSNEKIWKSNSKKVVNTSSEDEEDSSSSNDEDIDFVKLTAERKIKSLENYKSCNNFKSIKESISSQDVDFSFDFNNNNHQLRIANEEEEDLGEAIENNISPLKVDAHPIPSEPLGFMDIEDSSESDNDINKDELLKAIEQDSDGVDTSIETGDEEYNLLKEEADNIAQEYDEDGLKLNSINVDSKNSIVNEMIKYHKSEMNNEETLQFVSEDEYDSEDDYDDNNNSNEFTIPFFDDGFLKSQTNQIIKQKKEELDSDDDSYLWDYFFSSNDENEDESQQNQNQSNNYSDNESTDEDETLPLLSSHQKIGAKAQELLSSSSITARPPALGTWSTDSKPFGIIDGLSTRSLLSTKVSSSNLSSSSVSMIPMTPTSNNNNIEELSLDELLNMSELEDDEDVNKDWLEVTASDRKVPLSAFRNKGVINDENSHFNATRRFSINRDNSSPSNGLRKVSKKKQRFNEITMTPIRVMTKSRNKKKTSKRRRQSIAEAAVEGLRVTRSGLFSEDTLNNVEEFLSGLGNDAELSILFKEVQ